MTTQAQRQGLGLYVNRGFTLEHPDDHILLLKHENQKVAMLSQTGATEESLQAECSKHLVMKHGWDGCVWSSKGGKTK